MSGNRTTVYNGPRTAGHDNVGNTFFKSKKNITNTNSGKIMQRYKKLEGIGTDSKNKLKIRK